MKNMMNALLKMDRILINETGIAATNRDFDIRFLENDFEFNEEDTRVVDNKILKNALEIINNKIEKIEIDLTIKLTNKNESIEIQEIENQTYGIKEFEECEKKVTLNTEKLIECFDVSHTSIASLALYGVRIDKYGYSATDTYRLYNIKDEFDMDITIPREIILFLKNIKAPEEITLEQCENDCRIKLDQGYLYFKPTDLHFPDVSLIINHNEYHKYYEINKKEFENILKKAKKVKQEKEGAILIFENKKLHLQVVGNNIKFKTSINLIECTHDVDSFKISLNQTFLLESLKRIKSKNIYLSCISSSSQCRIKGDDESRIEIIMPLALRD